MGGVIKFKAGALPLEKGSKDANRCLSIGLTNDTRDRIDEVVDGKRLRSAYVERACLLLLGLQEGEGLDAWWEWALGALSREDAAELVNRFQETYMEELMRRIRA